MLDFERRYMANEIKRWLDGGKKVYIENGSLNDEILSYKADPADGEVVFMTSACAFPREVSLDSDLTVRLAEFEDCLFVELER